MFFFVFNVYCFAILDTGWLCSKEKSKYSSFTVPFFHTHCGVEELTPDGLKLFFLFYFIVNETEHLNDFDNCVISLQKRLLTVITALSLAEFVRYDFGASCFVLLRHC